MSSGPILVTGAGGDVGSVSTAVVHMLLADGWPVRAFVRTDDQRAEALREAGADVFVGNLLNIADVAAAIGGCRRVYFSMSLSPYYLDATILMAAAAKAKGDLELLVNVSESEQTNLTFERMTAPADERRSWLGNGVQEWSPQQRAHWAGEQSLNWSGLPVVHIRAGIFVENPILTRFPMTEVIAKGELGLPFGEAKLAPIAAHDVAKVCANILREPGEHIGRAYTLTGPEFKTMAEFAEDYAAALQRPVQYVPRELDSWNTAYIDAALAETNPHIAEHLKTLTRLVASGRYYTVDTDDLSNLLGGPPKTLRWALQNHPLVQQQAGSVR